MRVRTLPWQGCIWQRAQSIPIGGNLSLNLSRGVLRVGLREARTLLSLRAAAAPAGAWVALVAGVPSPRPGARQPWRQLAGGLALDWHTGCRLMQLSVVHEEFPEHEMGVKEVASCLMSPYPAKALSLCGRVTQPSSFSTRAHGPVLFGFTQRPYGPALRSALPG